MSNLTIPLHTMICTGNKQTDPTGRAVVQTVNESINIDGFLMSNVLISDDPIKTINNVWVMLERFSVAIDRRAEMEQDVELKSIVFSMQNTSIALNHAQEMLEAEAEAEVIKAVVSGVEQSTPS